LSRNERTLEERELVSSHDHECVVQRRSFIAITTPILYLSCVTTQSQKAMDRCRIAPPCRTSVHSRITCASHCLRFLSKKTLSTASTLFQRTAGEIEHGKRNRRNDRRRGIIAIRRGPHEFNDVGLRLHTAAKKEDKTCTGI
jgi:hypothetical protein